MDIHDTDDDMGASTMGRYSPERVHKLEKHIERSEAQISQTSLVNDRLHEQNKLLREENKAKNKRMRELVGSGIELAEMYEELQKAAGAVFDKFANFEEYPTIVGVHRDLRDAIMAMGELLPND